MIFDFFKFFIIRCLLPTRNLQHNDGDITTIYLFINNDNNDEHIKMTARGNTFINNYSYKIYLHINV